MIKPFAIGLAALTLMSMTSAQIGPYGNQNKIFLIGGYGSSYQSEIIDLQNPSAVCPPVAPFPGSEGEFIEGAFVGGVVLACAGRNADGGSDCYQYDQLAGVWVPSDDGAVATIYDRTNCAPVLIDQDTWWLTGGSDDYSETTTEIYRAGGGNGFEAFVNLPVARQNHNMVKIDDSTMMLLGATSPTDRTFLLDLPTQTWTEVASPTRELRSDTNAGLVRFANGDVKVVLASGDDLKSSELYNFETGEWECGESLPYDIQDASSVPYGDTFLIVGGYSGVLDDDNRAFWAVDPQNGGWVQLEAQAAMGHQDLGAFLVPDDYVECV